MENFDRENIDELLEICQYFPPSKFCAVRYLACMLTDIATAMQAVFVLAHHCLCTSILMLVISS